MEHSDKGVERRCSQCSKTWYDNEGHHYPDCVKAVRQRITKLEQALYHAHEDLERAIEHNMMQTYGKLPPYTPIN